MGYILTDTSPAYELVSDITVSSATTSVSFTGLNFTSADDLLLVSDVINTQSTNSNYYLTYNGNNTITNYYSQYLQASMSAVTANRNNNPYYLLVAGGASYKGLGISNIKLTNSGYIISQTNEQTFPGFSSQIDKQNVTSTFTSSSITSITITGSISNAIAVGSRFRLYKLVAEKVADITVSTATTSVNITGLSIDKSSEYMLVSDLNNSAAGSNYYININGNNTQTNYYNQLIEANGTSVTASRLNLPLFASIEASSYGLNIVQIKLTNNSYFVSQSNSIRKYGTSAVILNGFNATSTFTATSISQITLTASTTNAIGVGSRFQLYKLR